MTSKNDDLIEDIIAIRQLLAANKIYVELLETHAVSMRQRVEMVHLRNRMTALPANPEVDQMIARLDEGIAQVDLLDQVVGAADKIDPASDDYVERLAKAIEPLRHLSLAFGGS